MKETKKSTQKTTQKRVPSLKTLSDGKAFLQYYISELEDTLAYLKDSDLDELADELDLQGLSLALKALSSLESIIPHIRTVIHSLSTDELAVCAPAISYIEEVLSEYEK